VGWRRVSLLYLPLIEEKCLAANLRLKRIFHRRLSKVLTPVQ
jgi:hypothetical protein